MTLTLPSWSDCGWSAAAFGEFRALESTVYDVLDNVDPDEEAQVDRAVRALNDLYRRIDWMPLPFYAVLEGKNHLPRAKIRPDTFDPSQGFLRTGAYRKHFFGDHSLLEVGGAFAREALAYSAPGVRLHNRDHTPYARLHGSQLEG